MCHLPSGSRSLRCLARLAGVVACLASIHPVLQAAAPTQILLSDNIAYENSLPGDLVGLISAVDPDLADTHTFGLVPGAGAVSHDGFTITGNRLTLRYGVVNSVGVPLDFETQQTTFSIRVRATDPAGEFFEQAIVILMGDDRTEDADGDGLSEADEEDIHGTSDVVFDTDADGFGDGVEISGNSSPMNAAEWPDYPIVGWGDFRSGELRSDAGASGLLTISSGQSHNLGLKPDGTVVAWGGGNQNGQRTVPAGLESVVEVAAGGDWWWLGQAHSLALKQDGTVTGWGHNGHGQISIPDGLADVAAIAAGRTHSLALKSDGTVIAWGGLIDGPGPVPADLTDVVSIAAGGAFNMALKGDGTVRTWGRIFTGTGWEEIGVPAGLSEVVAISAGRYHAMALHADGSVVCWGYNVNGQTTVPAGLAGVVAISAGGFHSLALKADGSVAGWGANARGQTNIPPSAAGAVKWISAGLQHSLAIRAGIDPPEITSSPQVAAGPDGEVLHQVEIANAVPSAFTAVGLPDGLTLDPATGLLAGTLTGPLRRTIQLRVDTDRGRLRQALWLVSATGSPPLAVTLTPAEVMENRPPATLVGTLVADDPDLGETHVYELVAGEGAADNGLFAIDGDQLLTAAAISRDFEQNPAPFSIRVRARDASLHSIERILTIGFLDDRTEDADGDGLTEAEEEEIHGTSDTNRDHDGDGFGDGFEHVRNRSPSNATDFPADPILLAWGNNDDGQSTLPAIAGDVIALAAGRGHTLALRADGTVIAWGRNDEGQGTVPPELTGVTAIAAGESHSLALTAAGEVVAWGGNNAGQSTLPEGLAEVAAISAAGDVSLALKRNGTVIAWGNDADGQLAVPPDLAGVVAISAGAFHCLALREDGQVIAWGAPWSAAATVPPGLDQITGIAAGAFHNVALKANGTVVAWGHGELGQLAVPQGLADVVEVGAGWLHGVAMRKDGSVVSWGSNEEGQGTAPPEAKSVRLLAAGDFHNVALRQADGFPRVARDHPAPGWPGQQWVYQPTVENAVASDFRAMGLPEDLEIDPATGVITGTITTGMRRAVRLEVATDRGTFARVIWLNTSDGNPPTLITLSAAAAAGGPVTLMENSPVGTLVGTLDVTDPDPGDSHALYVSVIAGSQNPYCLGISGNQLVVAGSTGIDYEFGQHLLTIRVRAYDTAENFRDEMFAISLLDDRTEDADGDGFSEAMEEDVFFTSDTSFTKFSTHDADKDGVPSLLEYAFNLDMKKPDAGLYLGGEGSTAGLPVTRVVIDPEGNPRLRMEYLKRIDSGLGYHPQFSGGLNSAAWADAPGPVVESPAGEGWIRCVVDDTQFTPAPPLRFGRVRVSR